MDIKRVISQLVPLPFEARAELVRSKEQDAKGYRSAEEQMVLYGCYTGRQVFEQKTWWEWRGRRFAERRNVTW